MTLYHCTCDPHGDNARCNRECCQPRTIPKPRPSREDITEAIEALRMLASRTRSVEVMERLARVAAWMEREKP